MSEPSFELVILIGDELRISELRNRGQVSLGRDAINEIQIDHPSVSRRHAVIRLGPPIVIEDLGSANGTFVRTKTSTGVSAGTEKLVRLGTAAVELAIGEGVLIGDPAASSVQ